MRYFERYYSRQEKFKSYYSAGQFHSTELSPVDSHEVKRPAVYRYINSRAFSAGLQETDYREGKVYMWGEPCDRCRSLLGQKNIYVVL